MQSGRIPPVFRQFFQSTLSAKSATDSHSQQKQDPEREPEREPTREEALAALELLTQQDEFRKNSLKGQLQELEGRFLILVTNAFGAPLKTIRGMEILRVLDGAGKGSKTAHLGRILDRRV
jgi:hypothetical protein